jgi:transposase
LAKQIGVDASKVRNWIERGELLAVNTATVVGGRPRWRIRPEDLAEFVRKRQSSAAPLPNRKRRQTPDVIEFF